MKTSALWLTAAAAATMLALAPASAQYSGAPGSAAPPQTPSYDTPNRTMQPQAGVPQSGGIASIQSTGVALNTLDNAPQKLSSAKVQDATGATVGTVTRVQTNSSGNVRKVEVSLTSDNKIVAIPANYLRFNTDRDTLNVSMTRSELNKLPST